MKNIIIKKDNSSDEFLYEQLYTNIKEQILSRDMLPSEKCPSIRSLAADLEVSVTTVMQAYNQLLAEGYIKNKPGSGYYVERVMTGFEGENVGISSSDGTGVNGISNVLKSTGIIGEGALVETATDSSSETGHLDTEYMFDSEAFDFNRWKKCASQIFTENSDMLLYGSDTKGEYALRTEIAKYLFRSRGVHTNADNIIIAAGTQQIAFNLGRILKRTEVSLIALEKPGYNPVKSIFIDAGFSTTDIPVTESGISIENLPVNIQSAVYVNPSNQFPTGVVMPAGKRYEILDWATKNDSFIIEDDYNSELKYFGKPLPTIKSLDTNDKVIYLGSFSSTLFSAAKISYMVLPDKLTKIFDDIKGNYSQTCSKAEQLTLAQFMAKGYYYTAIRKKRSLYTKKLKIVEDAFEKYGYKGIELINTNSGLFVTIKINTEKDAPLFVEAARRIRVYTAYIEDISSDTEKCISLYYSYIPIESIDVIMSILISKWRAI